MSDPADPMDVKTAASTAVRVQRCLDALAALNPQAVALARHASLAVRLDAALLRRLRLALLPGAPAAAEADLWFSDLAESRDAEALVLDADVAARLRDELARERLPDGRAALDAAYALLREQHAAWPAALRLEEALVYRALRGDRDHGGDAGGRDVGSDGADDIDFDALLAPALAAMASDAQRGAEVSRWVLRAMPRLPQAARASDAASALAVAATAHLGSAGDTLAALAARALPADLRWLLPKLDDLGQVELVCEAGDRALLLRAPAADEAPGLRIRLPATQPLLVELCLQTPQGEQWRTVPLMPGVPLGLPQDWQRVDLRSLAGAAWRIEPAPAAPAEGSTEAAPQRHCFVIQGFGQKTDLRSGRLVDLDQSYRVIRAAVQGAGYVCERLDEVTTTGNVPDIDVLRMLQADVVIVDTSCNLPEVLYQLGVCHGLRRSGTVLVNDSTLGRPWHLVEPVSLGYEGELRAGNPAAQALTASLQRLLASATSGGGVESPVFVAVPELAQAPAEPPDPNADDPPRCYAVMGFGEKVDLRTERTLDLDRSYRQIIQPAGQDAGCQTLRTDDLPDRTGLYETEHLRALWSSELVVVDLSTANADAAYALGVRHALRPGGTLAMAESDFRWGLDAGRWPLLRYAHLGKLIDAKEAGRVREALASALRQSLEKPAVDSPVYEALARDLWPGHAALPPPRAPRPRPDSPVVFISHLAQDREHAQALGEALERQGIAIWQDRQALRAGDRWSEVIRQVIERADYVIVLQTPALLSRSESVVFQEVALALERQRKMRPDLRFVLSVCAEGARPLPQLAELHAIFLDRDDAIEQLVRTIRDDHARRDAARSRA